MATKKQINISSQTLLIIFLIITTLILTSSVFDYIKSKDDIRSLLENHSRAFLTSLKSASENAKLSDEMIENVIEERLLNNANYIKRLYESRNLSNQVLEDIATENNLFRINVYSKNGDKIFGIDPPGKQRERGPGNSPHLHLQDIFAGKKDKIIIGLKSTRWNNNYRFVVAIAAKDNSAISINMDAEELQNFKKNIGIKALFDQVVNSKSIKYINLDTSDDVDSNNGYYNSENLYDANFIENDSLNIYEASSPFFYKNKFEGLIKVGIDATTYNQVLSNIIIRTIISGVFLIVFGSSLLIIVISRQNYKLLERQYDSIETFSKNVIQSVSDSIVVYNNTGKVTLINQSGKNLFGKISNSDLTIKEIFPNHILERLNGEKFDLEYFNFDINDNSLFLLISKNSFIDDKNNKNSILVIKDLTKQKQLEDQINKREKLAAMGELASGVAHEVRNPLNAIGTIVQQLKKDFKPVNNEKEFIDLTDVVYKEVKRINETVQNFLSFAKPLAIFPSKIDLNDILDQMKMQFASIFNELNIKFNVTNKLNESVYIDRNQIKQVFINLIQNSIDELNDGGEISIDISELNNACLINFYDNGKGIPEEKLNSIFNLYYTTKAKGSGIGLSIVQKIIQEHDGQITVESELESGTTFKIKLPLKNS